MNNTELHRLLRAAPVPDPGAHYWQQFPAKVMAEIHRQPSAPDQSAPRFKPQPRNLSRLGIAQLFSAPWLKPAFGLILALICVALGFVLGTRHGRPAGLAPQTAQMRQYFHEIQALFPNQIQAIVFDAQGVRLELAERPNVPASTPLCITLDGPKGTQHLITFSGQQIRLNGDTFEVLADRQGGVLIVGEQWVWSSSSPGANHSPYRIEARPLLSAS